MALSDDQRRKIGLYVRSYILRTAQNFGHQNAIFRASARWTHTLNVVQNLKAILDGENAAEDVRDVCVVAAYFHDIDHYTVELEYHAQRGAETAKKFLLKQGYDLAFAERVAKIVRAHHVDLDDETPVEEQVKRIVTELNLEQRMLIDAETLDKIGVSNIVQALLAMGQTNTVLAEAGKEMTSGWPLQRASLWKEVLTTPTGNQMGAERFAFYETFLKQIGEEIVMFDPYPQVTETQEIPLVSQA